ncbi:MAG TPA: M48 family metallopeptidase [Blastocatellia bacterium]|nr:M48 family metallopeptidase [Blastocatellia bacterium]
MKIIDNDTIESDFEGARLAPELRTIAEFARWARWIGKRPLAVVIIVWAFLFLVLGLANAFAQTQQRPLGEKENPELIGKRDINKGQIDFYSIDKEVALGRQLAAEVDRDSKLVDDPIVTEYVNRVGQNIVLHSDAKVPFTIKVIDSNEINAFALPGGFLYVNRAVLEAADNEAELAGVMAHEIGHVAARHGVEQASKANLINYGSIPLIFLGGWGGFAIRQAAGLAIPLGFLKFSRGMESEADRLGAQYLWASGYDPNAMITFFEKLEAKEKKKPGTIAKVFSTHPMTGDRITEVSKLVARFPEKQEYAINTSEFGAVKSRLVSDHTAQHTADGRDGRPTLKRRPSSTNDDGASGQPQSKRPTLKRGDSAPPDEEGANDSPPPAERPVLKRRNDTNPNPGQ